MIKLTSTDLPTLISHLAARAHDSSVTRWTYGASPAVYLLTYLLIGPIRIEEMTVTLHLVRRAYGVLNVIISCVCIKWTNLSIA